MRSYRKIARRHCEKDLTFTISIRRIVLIRHGAFWWFVGFGSGIVVTVTVAVVVGWVTWITS